MTTIELDGTGWAWGRNREIRRPRFVTVTPMHGPDPAAEQVWLAVYANSATLAESRSPIDLHLSLDDARALAAAILAAVQETREGRSGHPYACDYWLESRSQCPVDATVESADQYGAPFRFCARHWPLARGGQAGSYGPQIERTAWNTDPERMP